MAGSKVSLILTDGEFLPGFDSYLQNHMLKQVIDSGVEVHQNLDIKGYEKGHLLAGKTKIPCEKLINVSWRKAVIPDADVTIETDDRGFIRTDMDFSTSVPGIYAIGDVNGRSYLAHVASSQGVWLVNHLMGISTKYNFEHFPLNMYSTPEVAQIGKTEEQVKESGIPYQISEFPLSINGKALAEGDAEGFVRLIAETRYGQVLGVQIVARNATDMIAEASAFMQIEGTVYDVAQTIHAHPSVSEVFLEASRKVIG
jgi:dihydrolipoamide dehydrogenase